MKKTVLFFLLILFITGISFSQIINKEPLSARITGYMIDARLDPVNKTVTGKMEAFWVNQTIETVPDIQLHLYMNAFRSGKTTFNRGYSGGKDSSVYGYIDIYEFHPLLMALTFCL